MYIIIIIIIIIISCINLLVTCTVAYIGVVDVLLPAVGTAVVTAVVMYQYHQVTSRWMQVF